MKSKKHDISVRDLFRNNLEYAEIIPDASVQTKLMRSLARREFLRFNPSRFNIYYLGGIIGAGIATFIMFFSDGAERNPLSPAFNTVDTGKIINPGYLNIQAGQVITQMPFKGSVNADLPANIRANARPGSTIQEKSARSIERRKSNDFVPTGVYDSFPKQSLYLSKSADLKKLQAVVHPGESLFEPSVLTGCTPLKVHFNNKVVAFDSCMWTFGDGGYSRDRDPDWIFDIDGEYKVVLVVFGRGGSQATSSVTVRINPRPQARFEIAPDKAVLPDDEIKFLNYSSNSVSYSWDLGDGTTSELFEPHHKYTKFSNYDVRLVAVSEDGCTDSLVVLNAFSGSEYFIDFPNAFIPNPNGSSGGLYSSKSDEAAQVFHPVFSGVTDYQLRIFSKLGILIFESYDINVGWDGYFKGQLSNPGVYIWKIRGNFRNGEPFIKMGDVTLLPY